MSFSRKGRRCVSIRLITINEHVLHRADNPRPIQLRGDDVAEEPTIVSIWSY